MKIKVSLPERRFITNEDYININVSALKEKLKYIRMRYCYSSFCRSVGDTTSRKIFSNSKEVPINYQYAYAQLYLKLGYNNDSIRRYQEIKKKYIEDINEAWKDYYESINSYTYPNKLIHHSRIMEGHMIISSLIEFHKALNWYEKYAGNKYYNIPRGYKVLLSYATEKKFLEFIKELKRLSDKLRYSFVGLDDVSIIYK